MKESGERGLEERLLQIEIKMKSLENKNETYSYMISKNPEKEDQMDEIEKYIYNWRNRPES